MKLISHRGNILGIEKEQENHPAKIDQVLFKNIDCEIDVFFENKNLYLGHDYPQYKISINWLLERKNKLWIHCKNLKVLEHLSNYKDLNYFWHENDRVTLTSHGYIWSHTDTEFVKNSIIVLPERSNRKKIEEKCFGICSDYIEFYKNKLV